MTNYARIARNDDAPDDAPDHSDEVARRVGQMTFSERRDALNRHGRNGLLARLSKEVDSDYADAQWIKRNTRFNDWDD